ncbi:MAG: glutathione binding-like protein [Pseudomonadota bacterium]
MNALTSFKITEKWPATDAGVIQLYSLPTPNGVKASIALEEMGLAYEPHTVSFSTDDQMTPEFLSLNPNNKIPAIIDPNGPDGTPIGLFESGAILIYLADKTGMFIPKAGADRYECLQWLMFQMGGLGPMFGQFGHFHKFAVGKTSDDYGLERYKGETKRLLNVLENRLQNREFIMGSDYTIADMAIFPWVRVLGGFYDAAEVLELSSYQAVGDYVARCEARPASARGLEIPAR